jgi:hypothetical protein
MSLTKLSQAGNNLFSPIQRESGWLVTSRLGTGKSLNIFTVQNKIPPFSYLCIAGGGPVGGVVVSVESRGRHPRPGQREAPAMQVRPALPLLQQR